MPRLLIEPRPYSLIRVQNLRTPFLPRGAFLLSLSLSLSLSFSLQLAAPATHHHHAKFCNHAVLPLRCSGHCLRKPSPMALADREACKVVTSSRWWLFFARQICRHHGLLFDAIHRTRRRRCFLLRTISTPTRSSAYRSSCTSAWRQRSRISQVMKKVYARSILCEKSSLGCMVFDSL